MLCQKIGEVMSKYYSKMYFMKITSLRFFTVYGPYGRPTWPCINLQKKFIKIMKLKFLIMENTYEILHISNIIYPLTKILTKKRKKLYEVYNLASSNLKTKKLYQ